MITDFITGAATYIGGSDGDHEGTWTWLDGEPFTYSKWGESEPNGNDTENCLEITYSMDWNDIYCGGQDYKNYICETPMSKLFLLFITSQQPILNSESTDFFHDFYPRIMSRLLVLL